MLRHLLTFLSIVSLLLCVFICDTWLRAARVSSDARVCTVHLPSLGGRYTLNCRDGQFVLSGPPAMTPATVEEGTTRTRLFPAGGPRDPWTVEAIPPCTRLPHELTAAMRNDDLLWQIYLFDGVLVVDHASPRGRPGTPTSELAPRGPEGSDELCTDAADVAFPPWRLPPYTLAETARPLLAALEDENRWMVKSRIVCKRSGRAHAAAGTSLTFFPIA